MSNAPNSKMDRYWRANRKVIGVLLAIWGLASLGGGILFVEQLNQVRFIGLPLGFWIAQQGAIYIFIVLIFLYAWWMDVLDRRYHVDQ